MLSIRVQAMPRAAALWNRMGALALSSSGPQRRRRAGAGLPVFLGGVFAAWSQRLVACSDDAEHEGIFLSRPISAARARRSLRPPQCLSLASFTSG
ncbi:hypothetical protein DFH09DRAFT_1330008 [Mycena vulgaris]|nr:hypothetical protein DFH09DRAFT_1330008 [Mycena vulgaris]